MVKITALMTKMRPGGFGSGHPGKRIGSKQFRVFSTAQHKEWLDLVGFMDDHYPVRSAFSLLSQVLDEYIKNFSDSWKTVQADSTQPWPYLTEAITKFQDPAEADKLLKIQRELDETKIILVSVLFQFLHRWHIFGCFPISAFGHIQAEHKTIDSVLARGEKLDSLVDKSSDLSAASQMFYKQRLKNPINVVPSCKLHPHNIVGPIALVLLYLGILHLR